MPRQCVLRSLIMPRLPSTTCLDPIHTGPVIRDALRATMHLKFNDDADNQSKEKEFYAMQKEFNKLKSDFASLKKEWQAIYMLYVMHGCVHRYSVCRHIYGGLGRVEEVSLSVMDMSSAVTTEPREGRRLRAPCLRRSSRLGARPPAAGRGSCTTCACPRAPCWQPLVEDGQRPEHRRTS